VWDYLLNQEELKKVFFFNVTRRVDAVRKIKKSFKKKFCRYCNIL